MLRIVNVSTIRELRGESKSSGFRYGPEWTKIGLVKV